MLAQVYEVYKPAYQTPAYKSYLQSLEDTLKMKLPVDFTKPSFRDPDGNVIVFPKYKKSANPFLPIIDYHQSSCIIEKQPELTVTKSPKSQKIKSKSPGGKMPKQVFDQLLANLPFKNVADCKSSARSKAHFISKDNLVAYIKQNKHLEKYFPKKYASLSKGDLCDVIFAS